MTFPGDDLDKIMAVMQTAFAPEYGEAWTRRQVEDTMLLGACTYGLIAAHGSAPAEDEPAAGFYLCRDGFEEAELLLIGIDPAHRRKGLGLALLKMCAETARINGAERLLLEMRQGNPAEALYSGFGFVKIGERPKYYRTPSGEKLDAITFSYNYR